jgi:hypothetical protein
MRNEIVGMTLEQARAYLLPYNEKILVAKRDGTEMVYTSILRPKTYHVEVSGDVITKIIEFEKG